MNSTLNTSKSSPSGMGRFSKIGMLKELKVSLLFPYFRLLIWALRLDKTSFMKFAVRLHSLWVHNGPSFLVRYTKECVRIVQHFVSGNPVSLTREMPISIVRGLPEIIPGVLRLRMHSGDPDVIRGVLTFLSVYRILKVPSLPKFDTIVGPFTGLSETLPLYELLQVKQTFPVLPGLGDLSLKFSRSAGPNCKIAGLGIWLDIIAWHRSPLWDKLMGFIQFFPNGDDFAQVIRSERDNLILSYPDYSQFRSHLGRLSFKEEAAGKVRIFAIADSITQSVMGPLSDSIFTCLRGIPQDGTFNQSAPLDRLRKMWREGSLEGSCFYSYDLSAATDRLPVKLQSQILGMYFGNTFGELWRSLMTDREWSALVETVPGLPVEEESFRYSVGQPMGALSSWGMLALTHHFIVRLAARRVGLPTFSSYAILGDDVVIANETVAKAYHSIMVDVLGVSINLSKSLVSSDSFEFAKRLITKDVEVTPLGSKNALLSLQSLNGIPSVLLDLKEKGVSFTEDDVDSLTKSIPTVRKSHLENILWVIKGPFGFVPTEEGLAPFLTMSSSLSPIRANQIIDAVRRVIHADNVRMWEHSLHQTIQLRIYLSELAAPYGYEKYFDNLNYSPVMESLVQSVSKDLRSLSRDFPRWRLIFGGPLIMTDYYRRNYSSQIVQYIKTLITQDREFRVGGGDPTTPKSFETFAFTDKFRGRKFFEDVRKYLKTLPSPVRPF